MRADSDCFELIPTSNGFDPLDLFAENYPDLDFGNHAIKSELVKSSCYCKVAKHS